MLDHLRPNVAALDGVVGLWCESDDDRVPQMTIAILRTLTGAQPPSRGPISCRLGHLLRFFGILIFVAMLVIAGIAAVAVAMLVIEFSLAIRIQAHRSTITGTRTV